MQTAHRRELDVILVWRLDAYSDATRAAVPVTRAAVPTAPEQLFRHDPSSCSDATRAAVPTRPERPFHLILLVRDKSRLIRHQLPSRRQARSVGPGWRQPTT